MKQTLSLNGQSASYLAMDVLRDYIEHEKTLTSLALQQADASALVADKRRLIDYLERSRGDLIRRSDAIAGVEGESHVWRNIMCGTPEPSSRRRIQACGACFRTNDWVPDHLEAPTLPAHAWQITPPPTR